MQNSLALRPFTLFWLLFKHPVSTYYDMRGTYKHPDIHIMSVCLRETCLSCVKWWEAYSCKGCSQFCCGASGSVQYSHHQGTGLRVVQLSLSNTGEVLRRPLPHGKHIGSNRQSAGGRFLGWGVWEASSGPIAGRESAALGFPSGTRDGSGSSRRTSAVCLPNAGEEGMRFPSFSLFYLYLKSYEGRPPKLEFIHNCVFILTCLNFSPLQSTLHLMHYSYQGVFSTAQTVFELVIIDAF